MMSYLNTNIIPGEFGKVFTTDARKEKDLLKIKNAIKKIHGIQDVEINKNVFPIEFTIYSKSVVSHKKIENEVKRFGFHTIPKSVFKV